MDSYTTSSVLFFGCVRNVILNSNTLTKDLSDIGLLQEITGQKRNRAFSYEPYLAVFKMSNGLDFSGSKGFKIITTVLMPSPANPS
jgi:hypothetical protein